MTEDQNVAEDLVKVVEMIKAQFNVTQIAQLIRMIGPVQTPGEWSEDEFADLMEAIKPKGGGRLWSETSKEVARLVMVMGAKPAEAAAELGITPQHASQVMIRIRRLMGDTPVKLKKVNGIFPSNIARQLESISENLRQEIADNPDKSATNYTVVLRKREPKQDKK